MAADIERLASYFENYVADNNGMPSVDVNDGILKIFSSVISSNVSEVEDYLISEFEEGYPDIVAKNSTLGNANYWWWLLALNGLDDPFEGIKENWIYAINSEEQIKEINDDITQSSEGADSDKSRIGQVVELN